MSSEKKNESFDLDPSELSASIGNCQRCGSQNVPLVPIDSGLRLAIKTMVSTDDVPMETCEICVSQLSGQVSHGVKLRATEKAQQEQRLSLWKSRLNYVKKAKSCMRVDALAEAATSYEKYIKILEIIFNAKPGALEPTLFSSAKRSKEVTLLANVYWDLFCIYDKHPSSTNRMEEIGSKLQLFLPLSQNYPDLVRRARKFHKKANHKTVVKRTLKSVRLQKGSCFIATFVYQDPFSVELLTLRQWRDLKLRKTFCGRLIIFYYYRSQKFILPLLEKHPSLKRLIKPFLDFFVRHISKFNLNT